MDVRDKVRADSAKILIVDDDESILFILRAVIEREGHQVFSVSEGISALRSARRKVPDLIILDLEMPGMNGCEICQQLKADPATASIPIIFLSSHDVPESKVRAFEAGGVDYLVKPYSRLELGCRNSPRIHIIIPRFLDFPPG